MGVGFDVFFYDLQMYTATVGEGEGEGERLYTHVAILELLNFFSCRYYTYIHVHVHVLYNVNVGLNGPCYVPPPYKALFVDAGNV